MVKAMRPGSVMVDIAIDQGGCCETSRPTTHSNPVYVLDGVVHYCVTNMPGAVPRTGTQGLTNVTTPYGVAIADKGWERALQEDSALAPGANVIEGQITCQGVADAFGMSYTPIDLAISGKRSAL
jgi:alanine dehydrogenase